jgi:hypothetical protein
VGVRDAINKFRWFHATRLIGAALIFFAITHPKDPDRGTMLWIGATFIGGEFVGKIETKKDK